MKNETNESFLERCADVPPRDRHNQRRFVWATLVWAIAFAGASLLLKRGMVPAGPLQWALAALPIALSIVVLVVFARYLREADELQRLLQLQALAVAFGGTYFAIMGYSVFEKIGGPPLAGDDIALLMVGLYMLGVFSGWRRYR
jgi:hypothetical protein